MKLLKDILYQSRIKHVKGTTNVAVEAVVFDSRKVVGFSLFVAVRGDQADGHLFIDKAIELGAVAIVCEELPEELREEITYVQVENSREALGHLAANFFDNPSGELKLVGITGTNGKTTTATMLYRLFKLLGKKVGLISTVENRIQNEVIGATHTTPDPVQLNELLRRMVDAKCGYCFMEVSSHALHQHRVAGIEFAGGVFTNISRDHLDYHKTFDEYIAAKKLLFDMLPSPAFALVNLDDRQGEIMLQNCKAGDQKTYALKAMADFKAKVIENLFSGLHVNLDGMDLYSKLVGRFNAYNILCVYGAARLLGEDKMDVLTALSNINPVAGRFELIKSTEGVSAIVDYAHTPDALENILATVTEIRTHNEQVITVVGCGGNRDKGKRPEMASIACKYSDRVILTSDNPRDEDPQSIVNDMKVGVDPVDFKKTNTILDRAEAIRMACGLAQANDIVLIAGKGHEKYQEIKGERFPFDDLATVMESFKELKS
ncbi:UDP-N-acetylmuramoyl-L-alanyl-D-glutamate--2,6-diaminopimelate ligase [Cryomorphaceae bacterium 1068]|nr:UDP-N-acetylmuramoyl-L-alanyl-D-glutamate--2,6-diaminopimelate ligase [Cryomorphaceae bacterium 1068]